MITIDFPFFASIRDKLKQPFNATDYNLDQLNVLYNSPNMLANRTFCSEEFADGANRYFVDHRSDLTKVIGLQSAPFNDPFKDIIKEFLEKYSDFDAAMEYVETLKTSEDGEELVRFKTNHSYWVVMNFNDFSRKLNRAFMAKDTIDHTAELKAYYEAWLGDKSGYHEGMIGEMIEFLTKFTTSSASIEKIICSFGRKQNTHNLGEEIGNRLWLTAKNIDNIDSLLSESQKIFFAQLMNYKGFNGLKLLFQTAGSQAKTAEFFTSTDLTINDEISAESLFNELTDHLKDIDYSDINLEHLTAHGFDIPIFTALVKQYGMPHDIVKTLVEEDLQEINLKDDNIRTIFPGGNTKFKLAPISYTKTNGQTGTKTYTVEYLPKTDPTALFAGKMTNCCQFYTGDSSDQAVIPVYKDPNAGLIVVKEGNKIKGVSFAWLTEDQGLVLDSFEHMPEAGKAFIPFITALSSALALSDYKLYVGLGGKTPDLFIQQEDGELAEAIKTSRPTPSSEGYEPYGDSSTVYLIEPDKHYVAMSTQIEGNPIELVLANLSTSEQEAIKDIYQKFTDYALKQIASHCLTKGYDFKEVLTIIQNFSGAHNFPNLIDLVITADEEQTTLLNRYPKLTELFCNSITNQPTIFDLLTPLNTAITQLTPEQIDKALPHRFLQNLLTHGPALLTCALNNIKDDHLPKLDDLYIWNQKQIENLAENLDKLAPGEVTKITSTRGLSVLLIEEYNVLLEKLPLIKDEYLTKFNALNSWSHSLEWLDETLQKFQAEEEATIITHSTEPCDITLTGETHDIIATGESLDHEGALYTL